MSFIKKAMASMLGIGGTKIDTQIISDHIVAGEKIEGIVYVYGGSVEQQLEELQLEVKTQYEKEHDDKKIKLIATVQTVPIAINRVISPGEDIKIPFSFVLDPRTPISVGKCRVWISTRLDIIGGVDSTDGDAITVKCSKYMNNVLQVIHSMGFHLREVENTYTKYSYNKFPFVQEFEFVPRSGEFRGKLDELEVVFIPKADGIDIIFQIDRRAKGIAGWLSEALEIDETDVRVKFTYEELLHEKYIYNELTQIIKRYC